MLVYTIIVLMAVTHALKYSVKEAALRVSNGYKDTFSKYPYIVILMGKALRGRRICTGTLITPIWGLTAAHCLIKVLKYIQYGNISIPLNATVSKRGILEVFSHPRYLKEKLINDIGMFRVNPVAMNGYGNLSAVDYAALTGLAVEFAGFGMTLLPNSKKRERRKQHKMIGNDMPLQIGNGIVMSCNGREKHYICVNPKCSFRQYTMYGDSGGPLFVDNKIVGVLSSKPSTSFEDSERFYVPVSRYLSWINTVIKEN